MENINKNNFLTKTKNEYEKYLDFDLLLKRVYPNRLRNILIEDKKYKKEKNKEKHELKMIEKEKKCIIILFI